MPKGQPIRCRISSKNEDTFRNILGQCRKYNLLRRASVQKQELFILVSRRHQSLLQTIGSHDGVVVTEVAHFPEEQNQQSSTKREQRVRRKRSERVFSRRQKEIKEGRVSQAEPFVPSQTRICDIPIHEIREWAHFLSKGEFLALHNLTHEEFNNAVRALDTEVRISFTYTCREKGCEQVFGGNNSLGEYRKHLLRTKHKKPDVHSK